MTEETLKRATRILEEKKNRQRLLDGVVEGNAVIICVDKPQHNPIYFPKGDDMREKVIDLIKDDLCRLQKEFDAL